MVAKRNFKVCGFCPWQKGARYQVQIAFDWKLLPERLVICRRVSESPKLSCARFRSVATKRRRQSRKQAKQIETDPLEHKNKLCQGIFTTVRTVAFPEKSILHKVVSISFASFTHFICLPCGDFVTGTSNITG